MCFNPKKLKGYRVFAILCIVAPLVIPGFTFAEDLLEREVVVLAVNDVYRIEGVDGGQQGGLARVRTLRRQLLQQHPGLLLLHAGDFLFPSLLSEWTQGAHMVEVMNLLDGALGVHDPGMFVVFGNHEFEKARRKDAATLQRRIDQSEFQWLGTNIRFTQEAGKPIIASDNVIQSKVITSGNVRVGLFGLTTDMKPAETIGYVDEFMDPVAIAREQTKLLREQGAELVIALTHLSIKNDREILEKLGSQGPDLIIGGHEHQRHHIEIDGRWILKADADARTATVVRIQMQGKKPWISFGYRLLNREDLLPDLDMQNRIDQAVEEHEAWFCSKIHEEEGCLRRAVGETAVPLIGEELEIRRYETNLGNWVADQMRALVSDADIAFINAGSLRVNQTIPAGPITRRQFEELFHYDSELVRAKLTKEQLGEVLERAAEDWVGQGHWLQVSGLAFKHYPRNAEGQRVGDLHLFHNGKVMELPDRPLHIVTNKFLMKGGDGYEILKPLQRVSVVKSLKKRLQEILATQKAPILSKVDGRICNVVEIGKRPCVFYDYSK